MPKAKASLRNNFSNAIAAREESLKEKVTELQAELNNVKNEGISESERQEFEQKIIDLTAQLEGRGGKKKVDRASIDRDPDQPRTIFPENIIKERAESLRRYGQKTPIILIPKKNGRYDIFDGELRYRASELLGWQELEAVFLDRSELSSREEIFLHQIVTGLHSQKLHDLDLARSTIEIIACKYPELEEPEIAIPRYLDTTIKRLERRSQTSFSNLRLATPEEQHEWLDEQQWQAEIERDILELILSLQLNPKSVNSNVMPLLKLPEDLQQAIREHGLETSKVKELNKLSAAKLKVSELEAIEVRQALTAKSISSQLSLTQIKEEVENILARYNPQIDKIRQKEIDRWEKSWAKINLEGSNLQELKEIQKKLQQKINIVKQLIKTE
jgi:ParB family transcriptional regulator, chromosome partitioning protein